MHFFLPVILMALIAAPRVAAQDRVTPTSAHVEVVGLRSRVVRMGAGGGIRLQYPAAIRNPDTLRTHDVLRYWCYVPHTGDLRISIEPASLQASASIERRGTFGGAPMAMITIDPFLRSPSGTLRCVDSLQLHVTWTQPLVEGRYRVPPTIGSVINPTWHTPLQRDRKTSENTQNVVDPAQWYDPTQPHVRIETSRDGLAVALATDVLSVEPTLRSTPLPQLRLLYRGMEQPVGCIDNDRDNAFSEGDTLLFIGRHAQGDTTWLDLVDTTAVFMLTRRQQGTPRRIREVDTTLVEPRVIRSVRVNERIEVDSGYYHPGSSLSEDYSTFLTPMSLFEGFYWRSLNARARQSASFTIPFTPYRLDSFQIRADVVSSSDVPSMNPDHGVDVRVNGGTSVRIEGDGYQRHSVTSTVGGVAAPAVLQTLRVYASGVPGASERPEWFSEVLVDGFVVEGSAEPILTQGRLRGSIAVGQGGSQLRVSNVGRSGAFVVDTTTWLLQRMRPGVPSVTVRTGASRSNAGWIDDPLPDQWDVAMSFNDTTVSWSYTKGTSLGIASSTGVTFVQEMSADDVITAITSAPDDAVIALVHAGGAPSGKLIDLLNRRGSPVRTIDSVWTWVGSSGTSISTYFGNESSCGTVAQVPASWSNRITAHCDVITPGNRYVVIGAGQGIERSRVRRSHLVNLSAQRETLAMSDVVVITHQALRASADRWAAYRSKASNLTISVVDVEAVFDEYDAGRHSPESMRAFLASVWNSRSDRTLSHAVLVGSASWDVRGVLGSGGRTVRPDLVPTYGRPSSDYWFGLLDDPNDVAIPELIVSRFPVLSNEEATAMIDKIIQQDTVAYTPADRTALYVGGGETEDEGLCQIYQDLLGDVFYSGIRYTDVPLCLDTLTVCKSLNATPGLDIRRYLASGVGMMNYIGHGGTEVFDIEGWDPQELANSRYPVLATFSCLTGAFSNPTALCRNGQYLIEPSRGVVAAMGATGWQYKAVIAQLHIDQHEVLRTSSIRDIGRLMYAMKRGFGEMAQQFAINAVLQFNLLGDPFTRIRIDTIPEVSISPDRVVLTSPSGSVQIREDDRQANISVRVWNEGLGTTTPLSVRVRRTYRGITDSTTVTLNDGICRDAVVTVVLDVVDKVGEHVIEVEVDPDRRLGDRRDDNIVRTTMQVYARSLLVLEPAEYQRIRPDQLRIRLLDVVSTPDQVMTPRVYVSRTQDTSNVLLRSQMQEFTRTGSVIDWTPTEAIIGLDSTDCWIATWAVDAKGVSTAVTWVPVRVHSNASNGYRHFEISPSNMRYSPDSVVMDIASGRLVPGTYSEPIYVRSNGIMTNDPDRDPILEVRISDSVIVRSAFRTGLNVLTMRPSDQFPRRIRRFDTSPTPAPISSHNGFARECVQFLRDSVDDSERVIIAACDESFSRFIADSLLDDLSRELSRFGSQVSDSLARGSSYALVGSRSALLTKTIEQWRRAEEGSVTLDTTIAVQYRNVHVSSPAIHPVQQIQTISSVTEGDVRTRIIGLRQDLTEQLLDTTTSINGAQIPDDIRGVRVEWILQEDLPSIGSVYVQATPLPQWVIEPDALEVVPTDLIRGDTTSLQVTVRNARTTESTPAIPLRFDVVDASTMIPQPYVTASVAELGANQMRKVDVALPTAPLPPTTIARAVLVHGQDVVQRFAVLDRCENTVTLIRDSTPPRIEAYVSGRRVADNDQVPSLARFELRITDNARLPINDPEKVVVFVNGIRIRPSTAQEYAFIGTDSAQVLYPNTDVRAIVRFVFPMETGENLLIVRATDAFQNTDTLELSLFPVEDIVLRNAVVRPNPTSGSAVIRADVIADDTALEGQLLVSDAQGRLVRSLTTTAQGSSLEFNWDGRSAQNESLSTGLYSWRILLKQASGSVLKTVSGTLLFLR